jgi:hypothetical protein
MCWTTMARPLIHAIYDPAATQTPIRGIAMTKRKKMSDIEEFIVLPDSEKERIFQELEAETPEETLARSRPLNARERRQWRKFKAKAKMGRPKIGKGAKTISLTVELSLLKQADAYAKRHGISRAKLVAQGLQAVIGSAA